MSMHMKSVKKVFFIDNWQVGVGWEVDELPMGEGCGCRPFLALWKGKHSFVFYWYL